MHKINKQLQRNLDNWLEDRVENNEPLWLDEFYKFMRAGDFTTKELKPLKNKLFREKVFKEYKSRKFRKENEWV